MVPEATTGLAQTGERPLPLETEIAFRAGRNALETRLLIHSAVPDALNPDHVFSNDTQITDAQLGTPESRTYTVFNAASTQESHTYWARRNESTIDARKAAWRSEWVSLIRGNETRRTTLNKLSRSMGVDFANFNDAQATALYDRYFASQATHEVTLQNGQRTEVSTNMQQFVNDVIESYTANGVIDREALGRDMDAIQYLALNFGNQSSAIVAHRISAEVAVRTDRAAVLANANATGEAPQPTQPTTTTEGQPAAPTEARQGVRGINNLDDTDKRILRFLNGIAGRIQQRQVETPAGTAAVSEDEGDEDDTTTQQRRLTAEQRATIEEVDDENMFGNRAARPLEIMTAVQGDVDETNPYFIRAVPETLDFGTLIPDDQLANIRRTDPYYTDLDWDVDNGRLMGYKVNRAVAPWGFDLNEDFRFRYANAIAQRDSGILALSAIAARDPEQQARLHNHLSRAVLRAQGDLTEMQHFRAWFEAQNAPGPNQATTIFEKHDKARTEARLMVEQPELATRPGNARNRADLEQRVHTAMATPHDDALLAYVQNGRNGPIRPDATATQNLWKTRAQELQTRLDSGEPLEPKHYRWIEFLSHNVKIPETLDIIRGQSTDATDRGASTRRVLDEMERRIAERRAGRTPDAPEPAATDRPATTATPARGEQAGRDDASVGHQSPQGSRDEREIGPDAGGRGPDDNVSQQGQTRTAGTTGTDAAGQSEQPENPDSAFERGYTRVVQAIDRGVNNFWSGVKNFRQRRTRRINNPTPPGGGGAAH